MKFVECKDGIPFKIARREIARARLVEFINMNVKCAQIVFNENEYKSTQVAYQCMRRATERWGYNISVHIRNGEIFLVNKDL